LCVLHGDNFTLITCVCMSTLDNPHENVVLPCKKVLAIVYIGVDFYENVPAEIFGRNLDLSNLILYL
jgi:hypothetical protein